MNSRTVKPDDVDTINQWLLARNMPPLERQDLPKMGRIVDGLAACFLYRTDSSLCLIEGLVSNPEAGHLDRSKAVDAVLQDLQIDAHVLGFKQIVGFTRHNSTYKRVKRLGFSDIGVFQMVSKRA